MTDLAAILIGVSLFYIAVTAMLESYIKMLMLQGVLLFFIAIGNLTEHNITEIVFAAVETLLLKAAVIPLFLRKTIRQNKINDRLEPSVSSFTSLICVTLILAFGFFTAYSVASYSDRINPLDFGISISAILTGLFMIITHKKLITHVMGYMTVENGIFLLSLSAAKEMPMIVSIGVSMDIFIGVLLAGIFINRIQSTFEDQHIDSLTKLKD